MPVRASRFGHDRPCPYEDANSSIEQKRARFGRIHKDANLVGIARHDFAARGVGHSLCATQQADCVRAVAGAIDNATTAKSLIVEIISSIFQKPNFAFKRASTHGGTLPGMMRLPKVAAWRTTLELR